MQFLTFITFTALVAVISYFKTRKTEEASSDGYFLGGRSLTAGVIAGSLLLTNLSTEQIVGLNGSAYQSGLSVMVWETLAALAMVVTAMFLLPKYLKGGLTTVPGFLAKRFDCSSCWDHGSNCSSANKGSSIPSLSRCYGNSICT